METHFQPVTGIIETDLDTELVLLDPDTQAMYSLNKTGRAIWQALPTEGISGAAEAVASQFDVAAEQAQEDTVQLIDTLLKAGLIEAA